jgi:hypothetical protein
MVAAKSSTWSAVSAKVIPKQWCSDMQPQCAGVARPGEPDAGSDMAPGFVDLGARHNAESDLAKAQHLDAPLAVDQPSGVRGFGHLTARHQGSTAPGARPSPAPRQRLRGRLDSRSISQSTSPVSRNSATAHRELLASNSRFKDHICCRKICRFDPFFVDDLNWSAE